MCEPLLYTLFSWISALHVIFFIISSTFLFHRSFSKLCKFFLFCCRFNIFFFVSFSLPFVDLTLECCCYFSDYVLVFFFGRPKKKNSTKKTFFFLSSGTSSSPTFSFVWDEKRKKKKMKLMLMMVTISEWYTLCIL